MLALFSLMDFVFGIIVLVYQDSGGVFFEVKGNAAILRGIILLFFSGLFGYWVYTGRKETAFDCVVYGIGGIILADILPGILFSSIFF